MTLTVSVCRSLPAAEVATALQLGACAGDDAGSSINRAASQDCAESPNTCNAGYAAEGGEITWIVSILPRREQATPPPIIRYTPSRCCTDQRGSLSPTSSSCAGKPFGSTARRLVDDLVVSWKMAKSPAERIIASGATRGPLRVMATVSQAPKAALL